MLITFNQAVSLFQKKFENFEARELLFYAWLGPKADGLQAYKYTNDTKKRKYFFKQCSNEQGGSGDPLAAAPYLMFEDIKVQDYLPPNGRWITWSVLIARWATFGQTESDSLILIKARIQQDSLFSAVPVWGISTELESDSDDDVPKEWANFPMADILSIETEEGWQSPETQDTSVSNNRGQNKKSKKIDSATNVKSEPWTDQEKLDLLEESNEPGITHMSIGERHGITRQRVEQLLKNAKEINGKRTREDIQKKVPSSRY